MEFAKPSSVEETKILDSLDHLPEPLRENWHFAKLYAHGEGFYGKKQRPNVWGRKKSGEVSRKKHKMSRREWIEANFPIRTKKGDITLLKLNPPQRRFECAILRMERAQVPVRIQILKARAQGFSTYVQALAYEDGLRNEHVRTLIVADTNDRSKVLLQIANIARTRIKKDAKADWAFRMPSKATASLVWDAPSHNELKITSAETDEPGRGGQRKIVHMSEGAWWKKAQHKMLGVLGSLPTMLWTYGFDESTANGDTGKFHDDFVQGYPRRHVPFKERRGEWHVMFYAWWEHPDYFWTRSYGDGQELPQSMIDEIMSTLDTTEEWLLQQRYWRRWTPDMPWEEVDGRWRRVGHGWQNVSVDQLAWRRATMNDKHFVGNKSLFDQEFPGRPEDAFMASGRPVFSPEVIGRYLDKVSKPIWKGSLVEDFSEAAEDGAGGTVARVRSRREFSSRGGLEVWAEPEPGRQYVVGADTSGGNLKGDPAAGVVIDGETCAVVAKWRDFIDPEPWGRALARLGWFYNEAILGIEAYPSAHGLSAIQAATAYGYPNIYFRQRTDLITRQTTKQVGWRTDATTKPLMIDRVKRHLENDDPIPDEELLRELKEQRWGENEKMESSGHDDMFTALAVALQARDAAYREGKIKAAERPKSYTEVFWEKRMQRLGQAPKPRRRYAGL